MYEDCEICGKGGRLSALFGGSADAELCFAHCLEFDEWGANYPPWVEFQRIRGDLATLAAHAQGGMDCRAEMGALATRFRPLRLELRDAARQWVKDRAAHERASKKD